MKKKKTEVAIINRSFWPKSQVIGEALLQFAEEVAKTHTVCVITQQDEDLATLLAKKNRGKGVTIRACKAYTTSASGLIKRTLEAVFFMLWTLFSLIRVRPKKVYVSTNPPVLVPFIVAVYCRLFKASYVYHLQDIHPEAANIVVPLNKLVFKLLQSIDNYTLRHAKSIITLSNDMRDYILLRSNTSSPIYLLDNPSFDVQSITMDKRNKDIIFCGNAGRLQRIPLLVEAIRKYIQQGGKLNFSFAGGGLFVPEIKALADEYEQVNYLGFLPAQDVAEIVNQHRWALLPIDDEVTKYAFPSKSSGYVLSGSRVLAVCGAQTSVARWVKDLKVGVVCEPNHEALVECFTSLEKEEVMGYVLDAGVRERLQIHYFSKKLRDILFSSVND